MTATRHEHYSPSSAITISLLGFVPKAFAIRRIVSSMGFLRPRSIPLTFPPGAPMARTPSGYAPQSTRSPFVVLKVAPAGAGQKFGSGSR